jgi:hypothetical protein
MKRPLTGFALNLFRVWLYAPLVLIAYFTFLAIRLQNLVASCISIAGLFALAYAVIYSEDFRCFSNVTFKRILICFVFVFVPVILMSAPFVRPVDEGYSISSFTWPLAIIFAITPCVVMRFDFDTN